MSSALGAKAGEGPSQDAGSVPQANKAEAPQDCHAYPCGHTALRSSSVLSTLAVGRGLSPRISGKDPGKMGGKEHTALVTGGR